MSEMINQLNNNFLIEDLTYIPMGEYVPIYNRPYIVNVGSSAIDTINERMHFAGNGKVTAEVVNGVVGDIVQPSSVGYATNINSDWISNRKYIFILKVKTIDPTGAELNSYIHGYTDHDGITNNGSVDFNMVHYINTVIETVSMVVNTPLGIIRKEKLYKIYNVFYNPGYNDMFTQRPSDVLETINMLNVESYISDPTIISYYSGNHINSVDNKTISSTVDNGITSQYLSNILNAGLHTSKGRNLFINSFDINDSSMNHTLSEPSIYDNRFIKYMSKVAGFRTAREFFTFYTLNYIDTTIVNRFKVLRLNKNYVDPSIMSTPSVGDYWHGQDPVTLKAYSIIENSVSLACKYGFNKLHFVASNMTNPVSAPEIYITNFNSFINLEQNEFTYLLEMFKSKFISEIFLNETNNGILPTHIEMYVDLLGTSKINLSYAGYPSNWYTIPTFANSHFSPVVSIDKDTLSYTSHMLGTIIDNISHNAQQVVNHY